MIKEMRKRALFKKETSERKNKRGQEMSISTLLLLVLGVIVLVVIVIGFTQGWNYFAGIFGGDTLPGDYEKIAQSCKLSQDSGLITSYCTEFKQITINKAKEYANCANFKERGLISFVSETQAIACNPVSLVKSAKTFCIGKNDDVRVNKVRCLNFKNADDTIDNAGAEDILSNFT